MSAHHAVEKRDWTSEEDARLAEFWNAGEMSTLQMAERLGRSKNSVVERAHRLHLAQKPSPIKHSNNPRPVVVKRAPLVTLPSVAVTRAAVRPAPEATRAPDPAPCSIFAIRRSSACWWPIGEPGTRGFRFCDAGALAGKLYCQKHHRVAHQRVPQDSVFVAPFA